MARGQLPGASRCCPQEFCLPGSGHRTDKTAEAVVWGRQFFSAQPHEWFEANSVRPDRSAPELSADLKSVYKVFLLVAFRGCYRKLAAV